LGNGSTSDLSTPTPVVGGLTFSSIVTQTFTCGIATDGKTYCWGRNNVGQVGDGSTTDRLTPVLVAGQQ